MRQRVHDAVAEGRHSVVLDLSDVLFCDSSGVGVLIASRRLIRSCQGRLRLILPAQGAEDGSHVNRVLGALGVRRLFDVYPDVAQRSTTSASPALRLTSPGADGARRTRSASATVVPNTPPRSWHKRRFPRRVTTSSPPYLRP